VKFSAGVGYMSAARCKLFEYGPADATSTQIPTGSCLIYAGCPGVVVVVGPSSNLIHISAASGRNAKA